MPNTMECSCSCDYDYEPWDFFYEEDRVARKQHRCCECRRPILPGQKYNYARGRYDGHFDTFKSCLACAQIRRDFCGSYGGLREHIWDRLGVDIVTGRTQDDDE